MMMMDEQNVYLGSDEKASLIRNLDKKKRSTHIIVES